MSSSKARLVGMLLLGLLAAGCGGDDDDSTPGPANVSGRWAGNLSSSGGSGNLTLVLKDASGTVTGTRTYQQTGFVSAYVPAQSAKISAVNGTYTPDNGTLILSYQLPYSSYISQDVYAVKTDGTMVLTENSGTMPDGSSVNTATQTSALQLQN